MTTKQTRFVGAFLVTALMWAGIMAPDPAFGATEDQTSSSGDSRAVPPSCNLLDNSIRVAVQGAPESINAGETFSVVGALRNLNPHPVPGTTVVARITKQPRAVGDVYDRATDTVARFVVAKNIFLEAGSMSPLSFDWKVPADLPSGPYNLDFYIVSSGNLPASGVEYLGVPAGSRLFRVVGSAKEIAFVDSGSFRVNGIVPFNSGVVDIEATNTASVLVSVRSTHSSTSTVSVSWEVYQSMMIDSSLIVASKQESAAITPRAETRLSYQAKALNRADYTILVRVRDGNKDSIATVRIHRKDVPQSTVRSLVLSNFPPAENETAVIFGCISSGGNLSTSTVRVRLSDAYGKAVYEGAFAQSPQKPLLEFVGTFAPREALKTPLQLTLSALSAGSTSLASTIITYDCGRESCSEEISGNALVEIYLPAVAALVLLALLTTLAIKKRKEKNSANNPLS